MTILLNYINQAWDQKLGVTLHLTTGQSLDIRSATSRENATIECESASSSSMYLLRLDAIIFVETNQII